MACSSTWPNFENARSAIEWALSHDEVILAARVATTFSRVSLHLGMYAELRGWLDAVLRRLDADAQPELAARAWCQLCYGNVWVTQDRGGVNVPSSSASAATTQS